MLSVNIIAYPSGYVNTLIEICIELPKSKAVRLSPKMLNREKFNPRGMRFLSVLYLAIKDGLLPGNILKRLHLSDAEK